jgi:hypothetical protein
LVLLAIFNEKAYTIPIAQARFLAQMEVFYAG